MRQLTAHWLHNYQLLLNNVYHLIQLNSLEKKEMEISNSAME